MTSIGILRWGMGGLGNAKNAQNQTYAPIGLQTLSTTRPLIEAVRWSLTAYQRVLHTAKQMHMQKATLHR